MISWLFPNYYGKTFLRKNLQMKVSEANEKSHQNRTSYNQ